MNRNYFKAILFLFFIVLGALVQTVFAQNASNKIILQITDSLTHEPLYGASVSVQKHKHLHISDEEGKVEIDSLPNGMSLIHISYIGYHHKDVLAKLPFDGNLLVQLCPESQHLHETLIETTGNSAMFSGREKDYLSAEQIAQRQGQNISDLLKTVNGVTTISSAGGIAKPVIRGLSGQRLTTIQGNTRMEGQQWGDDHGPELDPFMANRIEVIKGASAVEFGPEAIGGVIRILPRPWLSSPGIKGQLSLQSLSNSKQGASSLMLEGRKGTTNYFAWRAQGSLRRAGDAHATDYNISNTGFKENAQSINVVYGRKKWSLEFGLSRFESEQGIFVGSHLGNIDDLNQAIQASQPLIILPFTYKIGKPYQEVTHVIFSSEFKYQISSKSQLRLLYSQQVNRREEYDAERVYNQALQGKPAMDLEIQSFQGEQIYERQIKAHWHLKVGVSEMLQQNTVAGLQFIIPPFQSLSLGTYALIKRELIHGNVSLGLRYDIRNLDVPEYKRFQKTYAYQRFFKGPSAGLTWNRNFKHDFILTTSLQSAWRPPAVNELYSYGLHYGLASFEMGDSLLKPERNFLVDISIKNHIRNWHSELSIFAQYFDGFIYKTPLAEPILTIRGAFPAFQFTQNNASLLGAEFALHYAPPRAWQWESRFSYLYGQNLGLNQALFWMPANRMEHTFTYLFRGRRWIRKPFAEVQSLWVAQQKRFVPNQDFANPPAAYYLINLNAGATFKPFRRTPAWNVSFSIQNALNQSYRDYLSRFRYFTNDPGINFILRIQIPF
ncbi:MAG: TonB-dependent receptor [Bacteroidia bacterium]|nr:TonB-dependent receptor [Bacteroidia bacterium]